MSRTRVFTCILFLFSLAVALTVNERSKSAARTFARPAIQHARPAIQHTSRNSTRLFRVGSQEPSAAAPKLEGCISCHARSEEHTSELQSPCNLVCRLLL